MLFRSTESELGVTNCDIVSLSEGAPENARIGYLKVRLASLMRAAKGKIHSGDTSPSELKLISEIERIIAG